MAVPLRTRSSLKGRNVTQQGIIIQHFVCCFWRNVSEVAKRLRVPDRLDPLAKLICFFWEQIDCGSFSFGMGDRTMTSDGRPIESTVDKKGSSRSRSGIERLWPQPRPESRSTNAVAISTLEICARETPTRRQAAAILMPITLDSAEKVCTTEAPIREYFGSSV
jgi:hypothetical protein